MMDRFWDFATKATVPLAMVIGGALVTHEVRLTKIESNRFTQEAARELERRIEAQIVPGWLKENINDMKDTLKAIEARLQQIEKAK